MKYAITCCFGIGLAMSSATNAAERLDEPIVGHSASAPLPTSNSPSHPSDVRDESGKIQPLSETDLDAYRGGETSIVSNQTLNALTSGNVFNGNFVAGSVTLSDNALSNFNGVGNFAINTGAQVSLQSGMNLTINVGQ